MGALEETAKATGGFIEAMRSQPLVLMMGLMNIALLLFLFYYLSRITNRTEHTVQSLFTAQDKLFTQWGTVIKDQQTLTEKTMHCILPEDALKLFNASPRPYAPAAPAAPEPLQPRAQRLKSPVYRLDLPPLPPLPIDRLPAIPMKGNN